jgi:hypothetical protein
MDHQDRFTCHDKQIVVRSETQRGDMGVGNFVRQLSAEEWKRYDGGGKAGRTA